MTENLEKTIAALDALDRIVETAQQLYETRPLTAVIKTHYPMGKPGVTLEDEHGEVVARLMGTEDVKTIIACQQLRDTSVSPTMRAELRRSIVTPTKTIERAQDRLNEAMRETCRIQRQLELKIALLKVIPPIVQSDKPWLKLTADDTLQSFSGNSLKGMTKLNQYTEMHELVTLEMGIDGDGEIDMPKLMEQVCLINIGKTN